MRSNILLLLVANDSALSQQISFDAAYAIDEHPGPKPEIQKLSEFHVNDIL